MKNKNFFPLLSLFLIVIFSCSKKDNCEDPIDCLPPLTTTGAGTIGCLIDGKPFTPGGSPLGGPTQQAFYQYVDGGYHFGLSGLNRKDEKNEYVGIALRNQAVEEGESFLLREDSENSNFAKYKIGAIRYQTNENFNGQIKFIKFENGIVSGTFCFDAVNEEGEVVEIREGRFDMKL